MTAILSLLTRISIILGVIGAFFLSLSDIIMKTDYLNQIDNYLDFSSLQAQIIDLIIVILYLVLFVMLLLIYVGVLMLYNIKIGLVFCV